MTAMLAYQKPLPPLKETQDDVIPHLYSAVERTSHFMGKRVERDALDVRILPASYPKHLTGNEFVMMSISGVVNIDGTHASVVDLDQFVEDLAHEFVIERQMFRLRYAYRMYYTWRERYKESQFRKIISAYDKENAISYPGFVQLVDGLRLDILSTAEKFIIYEGDFDQKTEEVPFSDIQTVAEASIDDMSDKLLTLCGESARQIAEFFRQIRAVKLLMQLDFEELHSLNALPPALQPFAADLKWKVPSIWRLRLREKQLDRERRLASLREDYIPQAFTRVQMVYTGLLVLECDRIARLFLERFSSHCQMKRRINKIATNFDTETGITVAPSREDFIGWIDRTIVAIKRAFLDDRKLLSDDIILDIIPSYHFDRASPFDTLARFQPLANLIEDVHGALGTAFSFVEKEVKHHAAFMMRLVEGVEEARQFTDLRDFEKLGQMIAKLLQVSEELRRKPKNIFHQMPDNGESTDFVVDMKPTLEGASKFLGAGIADLKNRVINELNNSLFTEIQEKWAAIKDKRISAIDSRFLETRMVLYALISQTMVAAWAEIAGELKASFDTVMRMYRDLNGKSRYTHVDAVNSFNAAADLVGISHVAMRNDDYEYDEEEEEEEEEEQPERAELVEPPDEQSNPESS
jgi:hypothetical protein